MRQILSVLFLLCTVHGSGQACVFKLHPVWPDTWGSALLSLDKCPTEFPLVAPSYMWDNGDTSLFTDSLTVGTHYVVIYDNFVPQDTVYFEIEQLAWDLYQFVYLFAGEIAVDMTASLTYGGVSLFNGYNCYPYSDSIVVYLLRNGAAIDSVTPIQLWGSSGMWTWLPSGYTYQTYLLDRSACGSYVYGEMVQTFSLDQAQLQIGMQAASGMPNGSIEVFGVVPDPGTPSPPPMPLTGELTLYTWPDEVMPVGPAQPGTTGYWDGLAPGDYLLVFASDLLCSPVDTVITVESTTGMANAAGGSAALRLWPVPATDVLHWSGGAQASVWLMDLQGRVLRTERNVSHLNIPDLAPGSYVLRFEDGRQGSFVKR